MMTYAQAVEQEALLRSSAFLRLPETLAIKELRNGVDGFHAVEVVPFTLRHLLELGVVKSPFLMNGLVGTGDSEPFIEAGMLDVGHVLSFLWAVSVERDELRRDRWGAWVTSYIQRRFVKRIRFVNFDDAVRVIREYVREVFFDWPESDKGASGAVFFASHAVLVHRFASAYGWTEETTNALPLRAACQLWNLIQRDEDGARGVKTILFNPISDKIRMAIVQARHAEMKAKKQEAERAACGQ